MAKKTVTGVLTELLGMERQVVIRARARSQKRLKVERLRGQLVDTQAMLLLTESVLETMKVRMESFRSSIESETGLTESRHPVISVEPVLDLIFTPNSLSSAQAELILQLRAEKALCSNDLKRAWEIRVERPDWISEPRCCGLSFFVVATADGIAAAKTALGMK